MVLAAVLIAGVAIVSLGALALQSSDEPEPTPTPEVAGQTEPDQETDGVSESDPEAESDPDVDDTPDPGSTPEGSSEDPEGSPEASDDSQDVEPTSEATAELELLTDDELAEYQPNELGRVMVLMYHQLIEGDTAWHRTPDQFRQDLQWLYDNGFYVIPIRDYIRNEIRAPAGKKPVVLTFDDGTTSQFRYLRQDDGSVEIDPDSAVGILEDFFTRYDDFGRGGLFSILPNAPFAWPDESDQMEFAEEKLQWLVDNGYELGNHTIGHVNLRESTDEEIKDELAGARDMIQEYVPEADVSVLAVPFGVYPTGGDTTLFEGFEYETGYYELEGALMVGAEPGVAPVHADFDPMWIPRINSDDTELGRWFSFAEENPGIMYVSDGNPETVTIPEELHSWLVGTLDEAKAGGKTIVRY